MNGSIIGVPIEQLNKMFNFTCIFRQYKTVTRHVIKGFNNEISGHNETSSATLVIPTWSRICKACGAYEFYL